jgi:hypothetical protein
VDLRFDKGIAGHRDFDIKQNVRVEMVFDDELIDIDFQGRNQNEDANTKMRRQDSKK